MAIHNLYIYLWHSFSPYVTFWAWCVSQRLAYRGHGHDWQSICFHYICHDLDVHTWTFSHQYQVKNNVLKYWNYDANSFWVKWRDIQYRFLFKREDPGASKIGNFKHLKCRNFVQLWKWWQHKSYRFGKRLQTGKLPQQRFPSIAYHLLVNLFCESYFCLFFQ